MEAIKSKREGNFTASNIYKLLVNPRTKSATISETAKTYILEVMAEVLTGQRAEEVFSHSLDWGKMQEPEAVKMFEARTGEQGTYYGGSEPVFFKLKDAPLGCSPDYVTAQRVVEFKCPWNSARHVEAIGNDVEWLKSERKEYYAQIQTQMLVMGVETATFVSYDPRIISDDLKLITIDVPKDLEMQAKILERAASAAEFMQEKISKMISF